MSFRRILVVELLGGIGDLLLALPAIHALASSHPTAEVDVLTFAPGDVLLQHDPRVAQVLTTQDHTDGAPLRAVRAALAESSYDLVVTTTSYGGIADLCAERAPRAVTNMWRGAPDGQLIDRRFLALLAADGVIAAEFADLPLEVHLTEDELMRARVGLQRLAPVGAPVVLVPHSGMPVKEWPESRWLELATRLEATATPVLCSGQLDGLAVLPPLELRDFAALLGAVGERDGAVVGVDTGPVRLGAAVGARAVGLFGPTSAGRYGLSTPGAVNLQGWPECPVRQPSSITEQECWWSARCPFGDGPQCMAAIGVDEVLAALLPAT